MGEEEERGECCGYGYESEDIDREHGMEYSLRGVEERVGVTCTKC